MQSSSNLRVFLIKSFRRMKMKRPMTLACICFAVF